jgi:hypothetical protein
MGRGTRAAKRRIRGEGTGPEDGNASPGTVSMHAAERGVVAARCYGRTEAGVDRVGWHSA